MTSDVTKGKYMSLFGRVWQVKKVFVPHVYNSQSPEPMAHLEDGQGDSTYYFVETIEASVSAPTLGERLKYPGLWVVPDKKGV